MSVIPSTVNDTVLSPNEGTRGLIMIIDVMKDWPRAHASMSYVRAGIITLRMRAHRD